MFWNTIQMILQATFQNNMYFYNFALSVPPNLISSKNRFYRKIYVDKKANVLISLNYHSDVSWNVIWNVRKFSLPQKKLYWRKYIGKDTEDKIIKLIIINDQKPLILNEEYMCLIAKLYNGNLFSF